MFGNVLFEAGKEELVPKRIIRSKINRSYDGLDREEKTGGLMAMRIIVILLIIAFTAFCTAMLVLNIIEENGIAEDTDSHYQRYHAYSEEEALALIQFCNASSPLPEIYQADISQLSDSISVNSLMTDDLENMIEAAKADGLEITLVRGYTEAEECDKVFNTLKLEFESEGATLAQAESRARAVFPPSHINEYRTGMLIKVSDESSYAFSKSKEYQWLYKHGIEYGFINRYTSDKEYITGIDEDLTVYRYVGSDNAEKMRSFDMCLEEYSEYCSYRQ